MTTKNMFYLTETQSRIAERLVSAMDAAQADHDTPEMHRNTMEVLVADFVAESQSLEGHCSTPAGVLAAARDERATAA